MIILILFSLIQPVEAPIESYQLELTYSRDSGPFLANVESLSLINPSGDIQWTRSVGLPATVFPLDGGGALLACHLAPEGRQVELQFVDQTGNTVKKHTVEYFQGAYVSDNMVAVLVHCANQVILFSKEGKVQATYKGKFSSAAIDATGTRVALTSSESLRIYVQSELIDETPISNPFARDVVFSPMGTRVAVLTLSNLVIWHQGDEVHSQDLSVYDASPIALDFDSFGENILIGLRSADELKLIKVSLSDYSSSTYAQPLKSSDETIIEITTDFPGWKVHLTSGWYRFSVEEQQ
jgi:hypothetical protein